jgi:membrane-bound serine protease (ClpP class)
VRRSLFLVLLFAAGLGACAERDGGGIDVIDVSGPLDSAALQFMIDSIEVAADAGQELVLLQINSRAVLDETRLEDLEELVSEPPVPVAVWLGPAPAYAFGGVARFVDGAPVAAAAPGSLIGRHDPVIAGTGERATRDEVTVEETDLDLEPAYRQYLQNLDGRVMPTRGGDVEVSTLTSITGDGVEGITLKTPTIRQPGLVTRFFRLAATPEAAFFFLVVGLTLVTFEFYALGPGVAAGVAALSLWLAAWGVVHLPVRPLALAAAVVGWVLLTTAYQRGGVIVLTLIGTVLLQVGGVYYIDGSGQIDPRWWLVALSVLAALFFFLLAMPTVQRSRLSTQTIGREGLVAKSGSAVSDFDPEGMVEVDGARWRATAHREAGISAGDSIIVSGVDGLFLEVERVNLEMREN